MERKFVLNGAYLRIPICMDKEEKKVKFVLLDEKEDSSSYSETGTERSERSAGGEGSCQKSGSNTERLLLEVMIPMEEGREGAYPCDYYAEIPVRSWRGRTIRIEGEVSEAFLEAVEVSENAVTDQEQCSPVIHFAAGSGWTNDPNGLIYDKGVYHFYFQYNPFGTIWNNMTWGHAVSTDLLHWTQKDSVLFPDEDGTMFSGCAIRNDRGLLQLPEDALLFYYTAAGGISEWSKGKKFTQKIAYSLDDGETLQKIKEPCIPVIYDDSRDPKVYWHEATGAYVMALWLKENDFGILRSEDLWHWDLTDEFTLKEGWECPDILQLTSDEGESACFFWSADGYYYRGEFDGYHFKSDGEKNLAYLTTVPYAAQTYSGIDGRVISVPWLRLKNDGRTFTGAYGIPVELSCKNTDDGFIIVQKPVRELMEQAKEITEQLQSGDGHKAEKSVVYRQDGTADRKALVIQATITEEPQEEAAVSLPAGIRWNINGSFVEYMPSEGRFVVDGNLCPVKEGQHELLLIVDDKIMEVFFDGGVQMGTFVLKNAEVSLDLSMENVQEYAIYEVK